jgi:phage shock protein PspC (stress-responsive transcriptional regulator)
MSDHETDKPEQPRPEQPEELQPEEPQPEELQPEQPQPDQPQPEQSPPEQAQPSSTPRRLLRSRDDRILGGVAGGLGKYFDVDPVFFRIAFVVLALVGGLGVFLYLAALLFVPSEDAAGGEPPGRSRALTIAGAVLLVLVGAAILSEGGWWFGGFFGPLGLLLVLGAVVWWLVWGRPGSPRANGRSTLARIALVLLILVGSAVLFVASVWAAAAGGGVAVAILVIAIGSLLALAAFRGGARWLIVPALAIAFGLGLVAAADIDLDGGYGERVYVPSSLAEVQPEYDLGAGRLEVDLRRVEFTGGERELDLEVGFGEAVLVVPRDVCVVADADVGAGYLRMLGWDDGGFNVGWDEGAPARPDSKLVVDAHVGMGALQVVYDPRDAEGHDGDWDGSRGRWDDVHEEEDPALGRSAACVA